MMKKLHSMVKAVLENLLQQLMFLPHSVKWEKVCQIGCDPKMILPDCY